MPETATPETTTPESAAAAATDRLAAIKEQLAAIPAGQWSWRGNVDYPETLHLASTSWTDAAGERHFGRNVIGTVKHELTERDARMRGVGSPDYDEPKPFYDQPLTASQQQQVVRGAAIVFRDQRDDESDADYAAAFDCAYDEHREAHRCNAIQEWLHDEFGEPRHEQRLAFTDDNGFLVEATNLAIYEVAPQATSPDDPKVYRRDITGFRHPVADFFASARADMAYLVTEVERLRANEQRLRALVTQRNERERAEWDALHPEDRELFPTTVTQAEVEAILDGKDVTP